MTNPTASFCGPGHPQYGGYRRRPRRRQGGGHALRVVCFAPLTTGGMEGELARHRRPGRSGQDQGASRWPPRRRATIELGRRPLPQTLRRGPPARRSSSADEVVAAQWTRPPAGSGSGRWVGWRPCNGRRGCWPKINLQRRRDLGAGASSGHRPRVVPQRVRGHGYDFGEPKGADGRMAETVEIVTSMWSQARQPTYDGRYFQIWLAQCDTKPCRSTVARCVIVGGGEQPPSGCGPAATRANFVARTDEGRRSGRSSRRH